MMTWKDSPMPGQAPLAETFWALRFGKLVDRFGVPWLVNCEKAAVENVA